LYYMLIILLLNFVLTKSNLRANNYFQNYALFAESLYSNPNIQQPQVLSEEAIDEEARSLDLNFKDLLTVLKPENKKEHSNSSIVYHKITPNDYTIKKKSNFGDVKVDSGMFKKNNNIIENKGNEDANLIGDIKTSLFNNNKNYRWWKI